MNSKISDKDKKDWEDFLSNNENLHDKDLNLKEKKEKKIKTFNISKLIVVTGKGIHSQHKKNPYVSKELGILKNSVPEYIRGKSELMNMIHSIEDANIHDGGTGAFYVYLKKKL